MDGQNVSSDHSSGRALAPSVQTLIHIGLEAIVISGVTIWLNKKVGRLQEHVENLSTEFTKKLEEKDVVIDMLFKKVNAMETLLVNVLQQNPQLYHQFGAPQIPQFHQQYSQGQYSQGQLPQMPGQYPQQMPGQYPQMHQQFSPQVPQQFRPPQPFSFQPYPSSSIPPLSGHPSHPPHHSQLPHPSHHSQLPAHVQAHLAQHLPAYQSQQPHPSHPQQSQQPPTSQHRPQTKLPAPTQEDYEDLDDLLKDHLGDLLSTEIVSPRSASSDRPPERAPERSTETTENIIEDEPDEEETGSKKKFG